MQEQRKNRKMQQQDSQSATGLGMSGVMLTTMGSGIKEVLQSASFNLWKPHYEEQLSSI